MQDLRQILGFLLDISTFFPSPVFDKSPEARTDLGAIQDFESKLSRIFQIWASYREAVGDLNIPRVSSRTLLPFSPSLHLLLLLHANRTAAFISPSFAGWGAHAEHQADGGAKRDP